MPIVCQSGSIQCRNFWGGANNSAPECPACVAYYGNNNIGNAITNAITTELTGEKLHDMLQDAFNVAAKQLGETHSKFGYKTMIQYGKLGYELLAAKLQLKDSNNSNATTTTTIDSLIEQLLTKSDNDKQRAYKLLYAAGCRISK